MLTLQPILFSVRLTGHDSPVSLNKCTFYRSCEYKLNLYKCFVLKLLYTGKYSPRFAFALSTFFIGRIKDWANLMSQIISFWTQLFLGVFKPGWNNLQVLKDKKLQRPEITLYIHVLFQARYFYWSHRYWKRKHLDPTRWHKNRQLVHKHIRFK